VRAATTRDRHAAAAATANAVAAPDAAALNWGRQPRVAPTPDIDRMAVGMKFYHRGLEAARQEG
jgi:hypothetical protein